VPQHGTKTKRGKLPRCKSRRIPIAKTWSNGLKEAGRRRAPQLPSPAPEPAQSPDPSVRSRSRSSRRRKLLLGALASLAYLQFFYADVLLEIAKLPSLIVFLPVP
jgi:hypothetical protein